MPKKESSRVSIRDIAQAAGVSKATVTYALQNKSEVSRATRERIQRIAKRLGYAPDARISIVMAGIQGAKAKDLLPIAWLNTHTERDAWQKYKFYSPYLEGARDRALQLGYHLEEIWLHQPGMTMRRISDILYQRGIEGIIVTHFLRHLRLDWSHLASVSLDGTVLAPRLHRVTSDSFSNFLMAIKILKRSGYQQIGICLEEGMNRRINHGIRITTRYLEEIHSKSKRVPPFFYSEGYKEDWRKSSEQIISWVRRYQPDVVVGHDNRLVQCVEKAGYRVPEDIGVVHLATDDDVSDWAGIFSNKRAIGTAAAEWVISFVQNRQFGIPQSAFNMTIQGTWHPGRTLLIPKPN